MKRMCQYGHSKVIALVVSFFFCALSKTNAQIPSTLIFQELLTNDPGWSIEGSWEFGVPGVPGDRYYPQSGYTGTNVYGYVLHDEYEWNLTNTLYLTTPAIDCTGFANVHLSFQRWIGIESYEYDHAYIDVSHDGIQWSNVWENPYIYLLETNWFACVIDISELGDSEATLYIRWGLGPTDENAQFAGWYIDDVELWGDPATNSMVAFSTDFSQYHESGGEVTVAVVRGNNLAPTSIVYFSTLDDSAISGADYQPTNGVLIFEPGVTSQTFNVVLLDDAESEGNEYFSLILSNASPGTSITKHRIAQILIRDEEAEKANFPFYESFDSEPLPDYWRLTSTGQGRIMITTNYAPYYSDKHLCMDAYPGGWVADGLNEAVITVDPLSATSIYLNVWTKKCRWDYPHPMPEEFAGSLDADGIAFSTNGYTWYRLWSPDPSEYGIAYTNNIIVDIVAFATNLGLSIAGDFQIKFQQYDASKFTSAGRCYDEVRLYDPAGVADVSLSIEDSVDPARTTSNFVYTIFITNSGPFDASGIVVSNRMPDILSVLAFTSSVGTCSSTGSYVVCSLGNLAANTSAWISILADPINHGTATVTVRAITSSTDIQLSNNGAVETTLITEPGGDIQFLAGYDVTREGNELRITVTRTNYYSIEAQVGYVASNGTAAAGTDYTAASGMISFPAGATSAFFNITVLDDNAAEDDEFFSIHLHSPTADAVIRSPSNMTVTINDDDWIAGMPFAETFESGVFSNYWQTYSSGYGQMQITSNYAAYAGTNHLVMDSISGSALNEMVLGVDLAGLQHVVLSFWQKEFSDDDHPLPVVFTNHYNGDGVSISTDGTNWYRAQNLTAAGGSSSTYRQYTVPLGGLMASNGLSYNDHFRIKFQQYGNTNVSNDGMAFDNFAVSALPGELQFPTNSMLANEDEPSLTVTVERVEGSYGEVSIDYSTVGGTASGGVDYVIQTGVLVFADGEVEKSIILGIIDDGSLEDTETFRVVLSNPAGEATLGTITNLVISIVDLRDNDSFILAAANLTTTGSEYADPGNRILEGVGPDIVAMQEFNITNASYRAYVDRYFGTEFYYVCETGASIPNGVISRWPITAWGEWDDPLVGDRDFVWATIDIPGDRDLHVVSVHLYASGSASDREAEARALTNYIAQAGFDPDDFLAICGDFNTQTRNEAAIVVLSQIVSDNHKPADQYGDADTNRNRDKPYDRVLVSPSLDAKHMPLSFGGMVFSQGMVFDSRLWADPPDPILTGDSGATDMQHMLVAKFFKLYTNYIIFTGVAGNGSVAPVNPIVSPAANQPFTITADAYHHISDIQTNGSSLSITGAPEIYAFTWSNVLNDGQLEITFEENLADHNVPEWWLASHGWTDNFDAVVNTDSDHDCLLTWEEYYANTIPTNENSCLMFEDVGAALAAGKALLSWQSASGRLYKLSVSTNNFASFDVLADDIIATPAMNVYTVQIINANGVFYRISTEP